MKITSSPIDRTKLKAKIESLLYWKIILFNAFQEIEEMNNSTDNLLSLLLLNTKKSLKIVHEYNTFCKKILVVGNDAESNSGNKDVYEKTDHNFVSSDAWVKGSLTNTINACLFKELTIRERHLLKAMAKSDLVIMNAVFDDIVTEVYNTKKQNITTSLLSEQKYRNFNNLTGLRQLLFQNNKNQLQLESFFCGLIGSIISQQPRVMPWASALINSKKKKVKSKKYNNKPFLSVKLSKSEEYLKRIHNFKSIRNKRFFLQKSCYFKLKDKYFWQKKHVKKHVKKDSLRNEMPKISFKELGKRMSEIFRK